jgi:exonuclease 3'-5' domain-containing protein 1
MPTSIFIDTNEQVQGLVDALTPPISNRPNLYIDLEGNNLSRYGTISLVTIYNLQVQVIYIVDICALGSTAFTTGRNPTRNLKTILEDPHVVKVFFDVRSDSDALHHHYGIRLHGVQDLQLMELASRTFSKERLSGLGKCIEHDLSMDSSQRAICKAIKETGCRLFDPRRGGSYRVFDERPLSAAIKQYCVQDVQFMPQLWETYRSRLSSTWLRQVDIETTARINSSQSKYYDRSGRHMARGPSNWTRAHHVSSSNATSTTFDQFSMIHTAPTSAASENTALTPQIGSASAALSTDLSDMVTKKFTSLTIGISKLTGEDGDNRLDHNLDSDDKEHHVACP